MALHGRCPLHDITPVPCIPAFLPSPARPLARLPSPPPHSCLPAFPRIPSSPCLSPSTTFPTRMVRQAKTVATAQTNANGKTSKPRGGGKNKSGAANDNPGAANEAKIKKWSDLPTCSVCNAAIDEEVKALECELCEKTWTCTKCLDMSDDLCDLLPKAPLHWFCDG